MDHNHHHHTPANYNRAFAIGIALNIIFIVIEVWYGLVADSLALLADAGHNFGDVLTLILAWGASVLAQTAPTDKRTYGLRKTTILASLLSSILLLLAMGGIAWESIGRIFNPADVAGEGVMVVAGIGVLINGFTAFLFVSGRKDDLNIRAAYLHMMADAGVSLGVVLAGLVIVLTGWAWVDPIISLAIVVIILLFTWGLFRESVSLSIDGVPEGVSLPDIRTFLEDLDGVVVIHDLHVWALSTTENALTVHLVVQDESAARAALQHVRQHLHDHFDIEHATIQVEVQGVDECPLGGCEVR